MKSLCTQWLCEGSVFYAKRCRGGTEVSFKITCDEKKKRIVWKGRLRPKREEEESGERRKRRRVGKVGRVGRLGRLGRVTMLGYITT